jgi:uncharacterized membrane protein YfcA
MRTGHIGIAIESFTPCDRLNTLPAALHARSYGLPLILEFILGGALVGFIVGATGVGGGSLMTPLLTLVFGIPAQIAVGTDLLFASITKLQGVVAHSRRGNVQWHLAGWLTLGSLPAAIATLVALHAWAPNPAQFAALVRPALAAALLLTAVGLILKPRIQALGLRLQTAARATPPNARVGSLDRVAARPLPTIALGLVIGVMVTLTSVGAGVVGVVALFFLYPTMAAKRLVAVDIAHAVPLTLVAGLGHAALGTVNWPVLGALLIGSLPAIWIGAVVADRLPEATLRGFLAAMLILIGARLALV